MSTIHMNSGAETSHCSKTKWFQFLVTVVFFSLLYCTLVHSDMYGTSYLTRLLHVTRLF